MAIPIPRSKEWHENQAAMSPEQKIIQTFLLAYPHRGQYLATFYRNLGGGNGPYLGGGLHVKIHEVTMNPKYQPIGREFWPIADVYNSMLTGERPDLYNLENFSSKKNQYFDYLEKEGNFTSIEIAKIREAFERTFPTSIPSLGTSYIGGRIREAASRILNPF